MSVYLGATRLDYHPGLDSQTDQALIEQCRKRDFEAFGKVVDAYQSRVYGFVKRMVRDSEDALDVTQEVFIRAFQAFDRFDGRSSLRTWLFRIAHNLCIDRSRRTKRQVESVSLITQTEDGDTAYDIPDVRWNPEETLIQEELIQLTEQALATMSEKLRTVLLMHDSEDLSYEEIAQILAVPVGTVKSRLFLARNHLKATIEAYRKEGNIS